MTTSDNISNQAVYNYKHRILLLQGVAKMFVVADIICKVPVITSSVVKITFLVA